MAVAFVAVAGLAGFLRVFLVVLRQGFVLVYRIGKLAVFQRKPSP
jgi:hypothetical protein